jgi:polysaccharide export outer membrane protein
MSRFISLPAVLGTIVLVAGTLPEVCAQGPGNLPATLGGTTDIRRPQAPQQAQFQAAPEDLSKVPLRAGDVLSVQVYNAPDLSGLFTVDEGGSLTLPLIGRVDVNGQNLTQAQTKIADALRSKGYILDPSVSITVQQYVPSYVTVVGEVQSPGRYQMLSSHSLSEVLAMSGGPTLLASGTVEIKRAKTGETATIVKDIQHPQPESSSAASSKEDNDVSPGDEITVKRAGVVYVLGGVFRPGGYVMQESGGLNVVQAIALASGTTMQASVGSMRVIRRTPDSIQEYALDYKRMVSGQEPMFVLHPQDVVYVPISKTKAILSGGGAQMLSAATAAAIIYTH